MPETPPRTTGSTPTGTAPTAADLSRRLDALTLTDERRIGRRLAGLRRQRPAAKRAASLHRIAADIDRAEQRIARRRGAVPAIEFPPELPVSQFVDELAQTIAEHQVVIVAGETGSGKSTQLPKICLQLGRGVRGMVGHTQPRRIAARALAERISDETGTRLGDAIGYTIRFGDHTGPGTLVKLMTDGILLAEIARDRMLTAYDTIIIDEAHERSLNIDFLLGYLTELLPRRPDLKVIITSATIDPQRFSRHFDDAPIVEVSGRTYPVEIRYRPFGLAEPDESDPDPELHDAPKTTAPSEPDDAVDQPTAICRAVDELFAEGDGDVLVFLSGEREITDTAEALRGHLGVSSQGGRSRPAGTAASVEVLPLYGRLSAADQHKVFSGHRGRRIVLATNVAETSLTVPGIRYVIDPGTARISRYSTRTKVQRLPIEKVSKASAGQRAGRCGRVADGVCIRLYSERDYDARPEFTDPEIARTSLASVILQMAALGLGDIASFPFVEPPDRQQITDGIRVLDELGALDHRPDAAGDGVVRLTEVGRSLAALPLDPQLARMIVEGDRRGCLAEILVITAALAIQDVREYPLEHRDAARAAHVRFADPASDFLALLNLWHYLAEQAEQLSGNAFRRMCRSEYLHYLRIREWQDLHAQLRQIARQLGMDTDRSAVRTADADHRAGGERPAGGSPERHRQAGYREPGDERLRSGGRRRRGKGSSAFAAAKHAAEQGAVAQPEEHQEPAAGRRGLPAQQQGRGSITVPVDNQAVHVCLLSGLLSHIGAQIGSSRDYAGTRGSRFALWPGSSLARSTPRFVVAAELVETSRLWGRMVASIDPLWAERIGAHLIKRSHAEPRWDARRGAVVATEKVTLLGVVLTAARTVQFDRVDPQLARELFISHALVEGDWETRHPWFAANAAALEQVQHREDRARRRDIVIDDDALYALYDARIPANVTSGRHLDAWWRKESRTNPDLLTFTPEMLVAAGAGDVSETQYPDSISTGGVELGLDYVFDPTRDDDGVTVTVPLAVLGRVDPDMFADRIPGWRSELAVALLRSLPKSLRRNFVPAPDFAAAALARLQQGEDAGYRGFPARFARALTAISGISVGADDFDLGKLPAHLRMTFSVVGTDGTEVAAGKDLSALQGQLRADTRDAVATAVGRGHSVERRGLTMFPPDGLAREIVTDVGGQQVNAYPALIDEGDTVGVRVFTTPADQARAMRAGTIRLLALGARSPFGYLRHQLTREQLLVLTTGPDGSVQELTADATVAAIDALLDWAGGPAWDADVFATLSRKLAPQLDRAVAEIAAAAVRVLQAANTARAEVDRVQGGPLAACAVDMRGELAQLVHPRFISATTAAHLPDLERYLQALAVRAERALQNPARDAERMAEVVAAAAALQHREAALRPERRSDVDVRAVHRMIAEFRVALFAQPMRTAMPVSAKRIRAAIDALPD